MLRRGANPPSRVRRPTPTVGRGLLRGCADQEDPKLLVPGSFGGRDQPGRVPAAPGAGDPLTGRAGARRRLRPAGVLRRGDGGVLPAPRGGRRGGGGEPHPAEARCGRWPPSCPRDPPPPSRPARRRAASGTPRGCWPGWSGWDMGVGPSARVSTASRSRAAEALAERMLHARKPDSRRRPSVPLGHDLENGRERRAWPDVG